MFPQTYEEWRKCITVKCGIPLTLDYMRTRIDALKHADSADNKRFRELYGEGHWHRVTAWFELALKESSAKD